MAAEIIVSGLTKTYRVPERQAGLSAALRSLVRRTEREVRAVEGVDFTLEGGETVALLGPNGAGKTTTLKMLAGLMRPTAGEARVAGYVPWERRADYLQRISMVLGNKSQMLWDIPPLDSFYVLGEIYRLPPAQFRHTLDELVALLDLEPLLTRPVRNLSLGERMKCELVAALLHRPAVLFLDEPTLGLDISMQRRLRAFIAEYNRRNEVTVILTSHYMADVVALCPRVILIHHGRLLYDGRLDRLAEQLAPFKLLRLTLANGANGPHADDVAACLPPGAELLDAEDGRITLRVGRAETPSATAHLLRTLPVVDLSVEDPPVEAVIDRIYEGGDL
jgi:ABC-2 type transport system ATP-binding protein